MKKKLEKKETVLQKDMGLTNVCVYCCRLYSNAHVSKRYVPQVTQFCKPTYRLPIKYVVGGIIRFSFHAYFCDGYFVLVIYHTVLH